MPKVIHGLSSRVEIPEEDKTQKDRAEDNVALPIRSLYGTWDAAIKWQEQVARMMRQWGFRQGVYNPCLYVNKQEGMEVKIHGDDFVCVGSEDKLKGLEERMKDVGMKRINGMLILFWTR